MAGSTSEFVSSLFNNWLKEWSELPYYNKYDLYLTGAFCQNYFLNKNIDTFDIDLFLTGKPKTKTDYFHRLKK